MLHNFYYYAGGLTIIVKKDWQTITKAYKEKYILPSLNYANEKKSTTGNKTKETLNNRKTGSYSGIF